MFGWTGNILRVDLSNGTVKRTVKSTGCQDVSGSQGLATKIYMNEVDPNVDPLSAENKLIFMTGPLTGTLQPVPVDMKL